MSHFRQASCSSFLVVDNRLCAHYDFQTEASTSSFQRLAVELVAKLLHVTSSHPLLPVPGAVAVAASQSSVRLLACSDLLREHSHLVSLFEPRFAIMAGSGAANHSWLGFFSDAVRQVGRLVLSSTAADNNNSNNINATAGRRVVLTLYSTDMHLFGSEHASGSIREGLSLFLQACHELKAQLPCLCVRVVCVRVCGTPSSSSGSSFSSSENAFLLHSELAQRSRCSWMRVEHWPATPMLFEEELKTQLGLLAPQACTALELPAVAGLQCEMKVQLSAHSLRALDCLAYMRGLETCAVCPRGGIHPLHVVGYAFEVCVPEEELFSWPGFDDPQSHASNRFMIESLRDWLSEKDLLLILRVPYTLDIAGSSTPRARSGETTSSAVEQCSKYWALIPPASTATVSSSAAGSLAPSASMSASVSASTASVERAGMMTLVMLADRDECIVPFRPAAPLEASFSSSSALFTTLSSEQRQAMKQQTVSFFETAIESACGAPQPYNPWTFVGGQFNVQFAKSLFSQQSRPPAPHIIEPVKERNAPSTARGRTHTAAVSTAAAAAAPKAPRAPRCCKVQKETPKPIATALREPRALPPSSASSSVPVSVSAVPSSVSSQMASATAASVPSAPMSSPPLVDLVDYPPLPAAGSSSFVLETAPKPPRSKLKRKFGFSFDKDWYDDTHDADVQ